MLGAGSWGTALAVLLSRNGYAVRLWGHDPGHVATLQRDRRNQAYLPDTRFPELVQPLGDLADAVRGAEALILVVPSHAFSEVVRGLAPLLSPSLGLTWATKGFEPGGARLLHEVAREILGNRDLAVVSGPSFAAEVARGLPTAVTVASPAPEYARRIASYLHSERFRAYTSDDIIGVQVGGAAKNVLAIATGIADGLGFGANTRAALITRGLAELIRLGAALGGRAETFMGLAGLGDLVLTCTDDQSRNRRLGLALARGLSVAQAKAQIGQEVEGVHTAREVFHIARRLGIEMPISEQVYGVLYGGVTPQQATHALLVRSSKAEF